MNLLSSTPEVTYQGQFGEFTITNSDRLGVIIYRLGLGIAALSFCVGSGLMLTYGSLPWVVHTITVLFGLFSLGLGLSLLTIHIYLKLLHRLLQIFWLIGTISALILVWLSGKSLVMLVGEYPLTLLGIGFTFASLTGIYFKEAFCFNRLETKLLTPLVPLLLLGHLSGILPLVYEQILLTVWGGLFVIFALRKFWQPIDPDIGDKSVFAYHELLTDFNSGDSRGFGSALSVGSKDVS